MESLDSKNKILAKLDELEGESSMPVVIGVKIDTDLCRKVCYEPSKNIIRHEAMSRTFSRRLEYP